MTAKLEPLAPTVHLNGTSGAALLAENRAAAAAVRAAIEAVMAAAPNARDYYVVGPQAFPQARDEHRARLVKLYEVAVDLDCIGMRIAQQNDRRKR